MHVVHRRVETNILVHVKSNSCEATMRYDEAGFRSTQPVRRHVLRLFAVLPLALAGCGVNMKADPKKPRPKTHITGRGGGPGR